MAESRLARVVSVLVFVIGCCLVDVAFTQSNTKPTKKSPPTPPPFSIPTDFRRSELAVRGSTAPPPLANATAFLVLPGFDWELAKRFGVDANANDIPDLPNTFEYVHNLPAGYCATSGRGTSSSCANLSPKFNVQFQSGGSLVLPPRSGAPSSYKVAYKWRVSGTNGTLEAEAATASPKWDAKLAEGIYDVTLTVYAAEDITAGGVPVNVYAERSMTRRIPIEDILIVSIGDSLSSGEGNPERVRGQVGTLDPNGYYVPRWAEDGTGNASSLINQQHQRAHRSTLAWAAQAALGIENADKHTSVTFVSAATTGAGIDKGILLPGGGSDDEPMPSQMPAQIDQIAQMVGRRQIDILTVSVGINDAGFTNILAAFLFGNESGAIDTRIAARVGAKGSYLQLSSFHQRQVVAQAAKTANWANILDTSDPDGFPCRVCIGIDNIRAAYQRLGTALRARFPDQISHVWAVNYPDPTSYRSGNDVYWCQKVLDDLMTSRGGLAGSAVSWAMPDLEIGGLEQQTLVNEILRDLNSAVQAGATGNGWNFISLGGDFYGHGYCAVAPNFRPTDAYWFGLGNPFPGTVPPSAPDTSWMRTAQHSALLQGPLATCPDPQFPKCVRVATETLGTMHPNELGHQRIKERLLGPIVLPVEVLGIGIHDTDDQLSEPRAYSARIRDLILPSTDVDVFKVDTAALPETSFRYRPGETVPVGLQLDISLTSDGSVGLRPMVRVYDSVGVLLEERAATAVGGSISITRALASDATYFVAISEATNSAFDIKTGWGDRGGGGQGYYNLAIAKGRFTRGR
jgi:lysophospholipase L1-like esterase